jgi:hypothetical protein
MVRLSKKTRVDDLLSNKCAFPMETPLGRKEKETQIIDIGTQ